MQKVPTRWMAALQPIYCSNCVLCS